MFEFRGAGAGASAGERIASRARNRTAHRVRWTGAGLIVLLWPGTAAAQDWRTVTSARQFAGEEVLRVEVEYGAGRLDVQPAQGNALYRATLRYDADVFRPVTRYQHGRLKLGLDGKGKLRNLKHGGARLQLELGAAAPVDLDLEFGAVEAQLELGGLRVRRLEISTGASESTLRFSEPNTERLERMDLEMGAAEFRAYGLGNANVERLHVSGGVGDILLDFTGEWRGNTRAQLSLGLGTLTLRLPRGLGVRLTKDSILASFDTQELIKRGDAYYSQNWESAARRLEIDVDAALGSVHVQWVDGGGSIL